MYKTIRIRKALAGAMAAVMAVAASGGLALGVIAAVQADAEAKVEDRIDLPIIMYHGLLKEEKRQGQFQLHPFSSCAFSLQGQPNRCCYKGRRSGNRRF